MYKPCGQNLGEFWAPYVEDNGNSFKCWIIMSMRILSNWNNNFLWYLILFQSYAWTCSGTHIFEIIWEKNHRWYAYSCQANYESRVAFSKPQNLLYQTYNFLALKKMPGNLYGLIKMVEPGKRCLLLLNEFEWTTHVSKPRLATITNDIEPLFNDIPKQ